MSKGQAGLVKVDRVSLSHALGSSFELRYISKKGFFTGQVAISLPVMLEHMMTSDILEDRG